MNDFSDIEDDFFTGKEHTPLREDAFLLSPNQKIEKIEALFGEIMHTLGLDMTDDSLKDSPKRVAKMYVNEIFGGLLPENKPSISTFKNQYKYRQMLVEKDITVYSFCEHHFLPIIGRAHVAYISNKQNCRLLFQTPAGSGKTYHADCASDERSFGNRRCSLHYRRKTPVCKLPRDKRYRKQHDNCRTKRAFPKKPYDKKRIPALCRKPRKT